MMYLSFSVKLFCNQSSVIQRTKTDICYDPTNDNFSKQRKSLSGFIQHGGDSGKQKPHVAV